MLAIGLAWLTLAYLDHRNEDYERRLIGALDFLDRALEAAGGSGAAFYGPSIEPHSQPGHWLVSGLIVPDDSAAEYLRLKRGRGSFSALLASTCRDYVNPTCWRLERLSVDGGMVDLSNVARSEPSKTHKDGTGATAAVASLRKEPLMPAIDGATIAQATVHVPLVQKPKKATPKVLPCVDPAAWHDPDLGRNKQLILHEKICLTSTVFVENRLKWRVQVLDSGRPGHNWVVVHDDEDAAFDSALYAIVRYGGKVIDVDQRYSALSHAIVDPNHNFGTTDAQTRSCGEWIHWSSPIFTSTIIKALGPPPYVALHNNYNGHFQSGGAGNISVRHSTRGLFGLPAYNAVGRLADEDNFILISGLTPPDRLTDRVRDLTETLRNSGVNVIYEYVHDTSYDCSLSNFLLTYAGIEPGEYFNVEAEVGDYRSQVAMIDTLMRTLSQPPPAPQMVKDVVAADGIGEAVTIQH